MREPKVRVMNGLRVRLPGDARRRAAAVKTVDRRMALLEARRAAPTSHEDPVVAELLPVFVSSAELDPTATPRDMAVAERAIDEVMRPQSSVLQASEAAWVIRRAAELAESMGAARSEPGSGSWDLVGVPGLRTAVDDPVETLLYIVEPRSERARFVQHGASVPGVSRDLTEHLNVIAIRDFVMSDPVTTDKILKTLDLRRRTGSPAHTPSDVDATRIEFERAVGSALLRDAWSREHGHAPQF